MAISVKDFWKLAIASQLVSLEECKRLHAAFALLPDAEPTNVTALAQWLVTSGVLSRYQAMALLAGRSDRFVFGNYKVFDHYETGRLTGLYRAIHGPTGRTVLLYFFPHALQHDPQRWALAAGQARVAISQECQRVSRVLELIDFDSLKFLVIEDLQGGTLADAMSRGPVPPAEACRLVQDLAFAIAELHAIGQAHADIRPENVWVTHEGNLRLLGFPFARGPATSPVFHVNNLQPSARLLAQADYLAPELAQAKHPDGLADIYAAGCLLYELLSGRPPFAGGTPAEKIARHLTEPIVPLTQFGIPLPLAKLVEQMMAKDPLLRLTAANNVASRLESFGLASPKWSTGFMQNTSATVMESTPIPSEHPTADITNVVTTEMVSSLRRKRRRSNPIPALFVTFSVAGILALAAWYAFGPIESSTMSRNQVDSLPAGNEPGEPINSSFADEEQTPAINPNQGNDNEVLVATVDQPLTQEPKIELVADDGKTLWISPTSGEPLNLRYFPGGAQAVLVLRTAEIMANANSAKILEALGPTGQIALNQLKAITRCELTEIEQLTIAFYPDETGAPQVVLVMRLKAELPLDTLLTRWNRPEPVEHKGKKYFKGPIYAYYLPEEETGQVVTIARAIEIEEVIDSSTPPLRKELARLFADSDQQRHVTIFFEPFSSFTMGKSLFTGDLERLMEPLDRFLGKDVQTAMVSCHVGDNLFLELRAYAPVYENPLQIASRYRDQLAKLPAEIEALIGSSGPQFFGGPILQQFPRMIEALANYTRIGQERRQAVLRCYLPATAGYNLVLGSELALSEPPALGISVSNEQLPPDHSVAPAEALQQTISLSFPRDTLENCLALLSKEIGIEIVILGADLQLEGITKNQSFGLNERNKPGSEILHRVLKLANPDGKLVYVIKLNNLGRATIFITTRSAAAKRGDQLPPELAPKANAKG